MDGHKKAQKAQKEAVFCDLCALYGSVLRLRTRFLSYSVKNNAFLRALPPTLDDVTTNYFREWLSQAVHLAELIRKLGTAGGAERHRLAEEIMKSTHTEYGWNGWFTTVLATLMRKQLQHYTGARPDYSQDVNPYEKERETP